MGSFNSHSVVNLYRFCTGFKRSKSIYSFPPAGLGKRFDWRVTMDCKNVGAVEQEQMDGKKTHHGLCVKFDSVSMETTETLY